MFHAEHSIIPRTITGRLLTRAVRERIVEQSVSQEEQRPLARVGGLQRPQQAGCERVQFHGSARKNTASPREVLGGSTAFLSDFSVLSTAATSRTHPPNSPRLCIPRDLSL